MAEAIPASPQEVYRRSIIIEADTVTLERQRKEGQSRGFTVYCDESEAIGGDNPHRLLAYFTMALALTADADWPVCLMNA